jgi:mannose-6-phosphate isomerase-like protein (cupin superfamily)
MLDNQLSIVDQDKISAFFDVLRSMPQAPAFKTEHTFHNGMYCRKMHIPRGSVIVSKVHRTEHLFIGCVGELEVAGEGESYVIRPGDIVCSAVGTRRAVFALTDVVVMTIHRTNVCSVDQIESELMEPCENSAYDVDNTPKAGVICHDANLGIGG